MSKQNLLNLLILFLTLTSITQSLIDHKILTKQILQRIKIQQDYKHYFIFFNDNIFQQLQNNQQFNQFNNIKDIKFYLNDCQNNKMDQCNYQKEIPLILVFNKIFIRFNGGYSEHQLQDIIQWINMRIQKTPTIISNKQQLIQQLNQTPEMFCYCVKNQQPTQKAIFYSLSKAFIIANFCLIDDNQLMRSLSLQNGNITMFKNGSIQNRIEMEYQNHYNVWENFVKINVIHHMKRYNQILQKRFSQQNKNLTSIIVACDFSLKCQKFWIQFTQWSKEFQKHNPNQDIRLVFLDQKQTLITNVYLHVKLDTKKLPALIYVKILSQHNKAGWFRRYLSYQTQSQNQSMITKFIQKVQNSEIKPQFLSDKIPSKNGFTGKSSQKLIQKVVANNFNQTMQKSKKHYILLISTLGVGCRQCQQFYKEYKKAASLLVDEDITFGYLDASNNQIQIQRTQSIPQILLFNKYHKNDPQPMKGRMNFDGVLKFLQNNAIINYSSGQL